MRLTSAAALLLALGCSHVTPSDECRVYDDDEPVVLAEVDYNRSGMVLLRAGSRVRYLKTVRTEGQEPVALVEFLEGAEQGHTGEVLMQNLRPAEGFQHQP